MANIDCCESSPGFFAGIERHAKIISPVDNTANEKCIIEYVGKQLPAKTVCQIWDVIKYYDAEFVSEADGGSVKIDKTGIDADQYAAPDADVIEEAWFHDKCFDSVYHACIVA